jgi:hypothetical protein
MKFNRTEVLLLTLSLLFLLTPGVMAGTGCGTNWLGGDVIGSDTVTPVGYDRPQLEKPDPNPKVIGSSQNNAQNTTPAKDLSTTKPSETIAQPETSVAGKWFLELAGETTRYIDLMLYPAGEMAYGKGNLTENNVTTPVTTRGSVVNQTLKLDILLPVDGVQFTEDNPFKLNLMVTGGNLTGTYEEYVGDGSTGTGSLVGTGSVIGRKLP